MEQIFDVEFLPLAEEFMENLDNSFTTTSLETMIDRHIGIRGTSKREAFENELRLDLLG